MKTIKYIVDRGFRRAGEVRSEEDAVAENLIYRGFAEEVSDAPAEEIGDGSAIDQYHPEGVEADEQDRGGVQPLPAELNAPGEVGSNAAASTGAGSSTAAPKGSKAQKEAASGQSAEPEQSQEPTGDAQRTNAQEAETAEAHETHENGSEAGTPEETQAS